MNLKERVTAIDGCLAEFMPNPRCPLDYADAFQLLIAVLLSAQCTDERVNAVTPRLFGLAGDAAGMLELGEQRIAECIRELGLFQRKSAQIYKLSRMLVDKHGGAVPRRRCQLEALPGVGRKTASVILAELFGQPALAIDTHMLRVAARWQINVSADALKVEQSIARNLPRERWRDFNLSAILYARLHCRANCCNKEPYCEMCRRFAKL